MNTFTYTNKKQKNGLHKNMSVTSLNHLDLKKKRKQNLKNERKFHSNHSNYFFKPLPIKIISVQNYLMTMNLRLK